jgi:hypothetical protein
VDGIRATIPYAWLPLCETPAGTESGATVPSCGINTGHSAKRRRTGDDLPLENIVRNAATCQTKARMA